MTANTLQGNQLRHDLNSLVAVGKNWSLPFIWAPLLRYVTGPILAIILSLAYPSFETLSNDPLHVMGFIVGHFLLVWCVAGFFMPKWLDVFIIPERRDDWKQPLAPGIRRDTTEGQIADVMETGSSSDITEGKKEESENRDVIDGNMQSHGGLRGEEVSRL